MPSVDPTRDLRDVIFYILYDKHNDNQESMSEEFAVDQSTVSRGCQRVGRELNGVNMKLLHLVEAHTNLPATTLRKVNKLLIASINTAKKGMLD